MKNKNLHLKMIGSGVYGIVATDLKYLCKTFVRIQEFYESPFKEIRGHHFTLEEFKKIYSRGNGGKFTYYDDCVGFNVPGHIVLNFFETFVDDLSPKEQALKKLLGGALNAKAKFYVIGTVVGDDRTLDHEIAHALYHINPEYRKEMIQANSNISIEIRIHIWNKLKKLGYDNSVLGDELQAFLGTTSIKHLHWFFGKTITLERVKNHRKIFARYEINK